MDWEHREVRVMGRSVMQPRLVAYMADDSSLGYTYSGLTLPPLPWSPAVTEIKVRIRGQKTSVSEHDGEMSHSLELQGHDSVAYQ